MIQQQVEQVYGELKRLALAHIRRERSDHTLSATGLVHEAYLRLAKGSPQWETRGHFLGIAAHAMRQVLVDYARARGADKRGGDWQRLTLTSAAPELEHQALREGDAVDVLALNEALSALAERDSRQASIVELRYFGGLSIEDTADALGLSVATIKREWLVAKLFLKRALQA